MWFQETVPQNSQLREVCLLRNTQGPGKFRPIGVGGMVLGGWRGGLRQKRSTHGERPVKPVQTGPFFGS